MYTLCGYSGPAPEGITNQIFQITQTITQYKIVPNLKVDISQPGTSTHKIAGATLIVEVIDSVYDYVEYMKEIFDFPKIKDYIKSKNILLNAMNGGEHLEISSVIFSKIYYVVCFV